MAKITFTLHDQESIDYLAALLQASEDLNDLPEISDLSDELDLVATKGSSTYKNFDFVELPSHAKIWSFSLVAK